ncbi:MAG: HEAT repeat domain-containing protein [Elusimicrobia bacterium]|nr:HEAT repeat domain-containing protein [Elusimicrobiota bacterium]
MKTTLIIAYTVLGLFAVSAAAQTDHFSDFSAALKAADAAPGEGQAQPLFSSLESYPMRCQDAQAAYEWLNNVKLDASNDGQMQFASRHAQNVAKSLSHATSPDCQEFIAKTLRKESHWILPRDMAEYAQVAKSRKQLFASMIRSERIRAVIAAAGDGKNEKAVKTLQSIQGRGGLFAEAAVAAIGHIGHSEDLDKYIAELKKNPRARLRIAEFGTPAIDRIMREVNDPNVPENQKRALIGAITNSGGHESIPTWTKLLDHSNEFVVRMAAEGIARQAKPTDMDLLKTMLNSPNYHTRGSAVTGLTSPQVWTPELAPLIIDTLRKDPSWYVKSTAATALSDRKVCEALPALEEVSHSSDKGVSGPALHAINTLNQAYEDLPSPPTPLPNREQLIADGQATKPENQRVGAAFKLALAGYQDDAFPILKDLVLNGSGFMRYDCMYKLWQMGDDRSREVMMAAVNIPSVKSAAESFLSRWKKGCRGYVGTK